MSATEEQIKRDLERIKQLRSFLDQREESLCDQLRRLTAERWLGFVRVNPITGQYIGEPKIVPISEELSTYIDIDDSDIPEIVGWDYAGYHEYPDVCWSGGYRCWMWVANTEDHREVEIINCDSYPNRSYSPSFVVTIGDENGEVLEFDFSHYLMCAFKTEEEVRRFFSPNQRS